MNVLKREMLETFLTDAPVIVDVRPPEQYKPGEFAGAVHIPLADIQHGHHQLPLDRPILLICERGVVSELAGLYLEAAGYGQVWNLEGGLSRFRKAG